MSELPGFMTEPADRRVPVLVLTGFLGAGKTTLLNRLLRDPSMSRTAVLINEFGEVAVDHHWSTRSTTASSCSIRAASAAAFRATCCAL